jgi:hypothetical protein
MLILNDNSIYINNIFDIYLEMVGRVGVEPTTNGLRVRLKKLSSCFYYHLKSI